MTAREYAASQGVDLIGKLTRKTATRIKWDWNKCEDITEKYTYYIDEVGTEICKDGCFWTIILANGAVI